MVDRADLMAMEETLFEMVYAVPLPYDPAVILDVGAHIGLATLFFRAKYPDSWIVSIEAHPTTARRLRQNVRGLGNVCVLERALAGETGIAELYPADATVSSSLLPRGRGRPVTVKTSTLPALLAELDVDRVDLLKLDIEGAEWSALAVPGALDRVNAVVAELHYDLAPSDRRDIAELFRGFTIRLSPFRSNRALLWAIRQPPGSS
jgi:FkbM family methyltransferase